MLNNVYLVHNLIKCRIQLGLTMSFYARLHEPGCATYQHSTHTAVKHDNNVMLYFRQKRSKINNKIARKFFFNFLLHPGPFCGSNKGLFTVPCLVCLFLLVLNSLDLLVRLSSVHSSLSSLFFFLILFCTDSFPAHP